MRYIFLLVTALSFLAGGVEALDRKACKADAEKFCKDVKKGGGRIVKCLREHKSELSSECVSTMKSGAKAHKACKADAKKFCKDVEKGGGRKLKCLKEHEAELSAECKAAL